MSHTAIGKKLIEFMGLDGRQVVRVLVFYSDDPNLNPTEAHSFFCKICVWKERK